VSAKTDDNLKHESARMNQPGQRVHRLGTAADRGGRRWPVGPVDPMLAAAVDDVPSLTALPGGTVYEPKWDGFRAIVSLDAGAVTISSRRRKDLTRSFPDIATAVRTQLNGPLVLDGELVVWVDGRLDFTALQQRLVAGRGLAELVATRPASYVVFDVLAADGDNLMPWPWWRRRERLAGLLADTRPPLQPSPWSDDRDEALTWFETWADLGIEGLVAKGKTQAYLPGQRRWLKVRHRHGAEVVVGAVVGRLDAPERLVLGAFDSDGVLRVVGSTGPLASRDARAVGGFLAPPTGDHPWPTQMPHALMGGLAGQRPPTPVTLAEPTVVVEVSVDTAFERGRWRHLARFVRVRADVEAGDVTVEGLGGG
jgi:ATP-dependent DNA ligase